MTQITEHVVFSKVNLLAVVAVYSSTAIEILNHTDKFFEGISHILSACVSLMAIVYSIYKTYLLKKKGKDVDSSGESN